MDCILQGLDMAKYDRLLTNIGHIWPGLANSSLDTPLNWPVWPVVPSDRLVTRGPLTPLEQRGFWPYY